MRLPIFLTIIAAVVVAGIVTAAGLFMADSNRPLLSDVGFDRALITPNADGQDDAAVFSYTLARDANVTIRLTNTDGKRFAFRDQERRAAGNYNVLFSGVVGGYTLPNEQLDGTVERRLVPNGEYTWEVVAEGIDRDEQETINGTLTIQDADSALPLLTTFTVSPAVFTPNQDGVSDRVAIDVYVTKAADLRAYLIGPAGESIYINPREEVRKAGEAGRQQFDYEGGIDTNADPPPDGKYTVVVEAQDAVGQRITRQTELEISDGGLPRAEIVQQPSGADVAFSTLPYDEAYFSNAEALGELIPVPDDPQDARLTQISVPMGDLLVFKVTVENYGASKIRTSGPPPGTVYQQNQLAATLGQIEQAGVWRVGIQCDTSEESYPYRWALGTAETLEAEADPNNDNIYYYLPAGERVVVWGAVRMTDIIETRNPQECWAGLVHEGVNVYNNRVGPRAILIADTGGTGGQP